MINFLLDSVSEKLNLDVRYFAKGTFYFSLIQVLSIFVGLVLSIIYANYLSTTVFGQYNFIFSFVSLFSIFAYPGLNIVVAKAIAQKKEGVFIEASKKAFPWGIISSSFFLPLIFYYLLKDHVDWQIVLGFGFCFLLSPIIWTLRFNDLYFASKKMFKQAFYSSIFQKIINLTFVFLAVFYLKSLSWLVFSVLLSAFISAILFFLYIAPKTVGKKVPKSSEFAIAKKINTTLILSQLAFYLDKIILGRFLGFEAIAIYSFALLAPEQIKFFFKTIITTSQPKLAVLSRKRVREDFLKKTFYLMILVILATLLYWFMGPFIFKIFFPFYSQSIFPSRIISLSLPFLIVGFLFTALFENQGKTKAINILYTVNYVSRITLLILLIPRFGLFGAVFSHVIGRILGALFAFIIFRKTYLITRK